MVRLHVVLALVALVAQASAFSSGPTSTLSQSQFTQYVVTQPEIVQKPRVRNGVASLVAKKGKPNIPMNKRGQFKQSQMKQQQYEQAFRAKDGLPTFQIFVRSAVAQVWYPVAGFKGDNRAKALVEAYMSGFLSNLYEGQIKRGVAKSVTDQRAALVNQAVKQVPALKKNQDNLEFGYKVIYEGLEDKLGPQKVQLITAGMEKGWMDNLKESFGMQ
mmetsp:Transcript_8118/g.12437  ORF Transcript_8118/g.12437 Transcript_8118/m.12437 type:complete len:216 (+) Transcript_8118:128-775(+)